MHPDGPIEPRKHVTATTSPQNKADWRSTLGRVGLSARGVLYLAIGYLALQAALGSGSGSNASSGGVFQYLKSQSGGDVMLAVLALGLVAYSLWQLFRAAFGDPVTGSEAKDRAMYAGKGVIYAGVAFSAIKAMLDSGGGGGGGGSQQAAGTLLGLPGGVFITAVIGLCIAGYGAKQIKDNGIDAEFMRKLSPDRYANEKAVKRAGQIGYSARGGTLVMIGFFFVIAAIQHNPDQAKGLGGAMATLSQQSYGPYLLGIAAIGLAMFGAYCLAEAKMRRDHD